MKRKSKLLTVLIAVCITAALIPSASFAADTGASAALDEDVAILFSGDINGSVDANIGVAGMAAYANEMKTKHRYVEMVDIGNAASGTVLASTSKGEYVAEAMNAAGYSIAVPGAGEFSYGVTQLVSGLAKTADYQYISCNFKYAATDENVFKP